MTPLKAWLKSKGMTQVELATLASVDHAHVCRVACGHCKPSRKLHEALADISPQVFAAHIKYIKTHHQALRDSLRKKVA